jgi:hypothetical protein
VEFLQQGYSNCRVLAPNGELLFRAETRKINWYLKKNLAAEIPSEDGVRTIKLLFEPAGKGDIGNPYMLADRKSHCVVCGDKKKLSRHHIVPYCFVSHFSEADKNHNSYDVVLLCHACHRKYEIEAQKLQNQLCREFTPGTKLNDKHKQHIVSAANALLKYRKEMSDKKKACCKNKIREYLDKTEYTTEDLETISNTDFNEIIYKTIVEQQWSLNAFARRWRYHFLEVMEPKFMHELWDKDRDTYQKHG